MYVIVFYRALFLCGAYIGVARLVGGTSPSSGRLEVYLNGQWGAVCDTHWTDRDASVICRQLGLGYKSLFFGYLLPSTFHTNKFPDQSSNPGI